MNFLSFLVGILLLSFLGFIFGLGLAVVAKIFYVNVDPKVLNILNSLPGANCGACGYAGCQAYAEAIVNKNAEINLCAPGGEKSLKNIENIIGKKAEAKLKFIAKVKCLGDDAIALKDYIFNGEDDCTTVYSLFQGEKKCKYGCIGKGNCIRVCSFGAIKRDELNRIWVDANLCAGCEKCLSVCPTSVIKMVPINGGYFVACSSHAPGKIVKEICKKGCIGCKICEKVTNDPQRISVIDNLAQINYSSNTDLHQAALKCPADVILPIINQKSFKKIKPNKQEIKQEINNDQLKEQT